MDNKASKPLNKKVIIINLIIIILISSLTGFYLVKNDIIKNFVEAKGLSFLGYVVIFLMIVISILCDSYIIFFSYKDSNTKFTYLDSIGAYMYGNLGSNITPAKSGHYPFMIYYYEKKRIRIDQSLKSMTQNQIIYSTVLIIIYLILYIISLINGFSLTVNDTTIQVKWFCLIGVGSNILFSGIFILMAFVKPINNFLVKIFAFILFKLKRINSKEEYYTDENKKMAVLREEVINLIKHIWRYILPLLAYVCFVFIKYSIPYIIYLFLFSYKFSFSDFFLFFSLTQIMTYVSNVVPIPGNTGVAEFTFLAVFSSVMKDNEVSICLIYWRLFTYYFMVILDFLYFIVTMVIEPKISNNSSLDVNA